MTVAAYKADKSIEELNDWESLRSTDYFIEYPRGMKICERNLEEVVNAGRLSNITMTSQGLKKLIAKRTDIYVDDVNSVIPYLNNERYGFHGKVHFAGTMQDGSSVYVCAKKT